MPFGSNGVFTPLPAATNAFPGKIIASSDWNAIFTDIAAALTTLGQLSYVQAPRVVNVVGNFTVNATDTFVMVMASAPTITLPPGASKQGPVKIIGAIAGIFGSHNSSVVPTGLETISGNTSIVLSADFQIATFYPIASGGYVVSYA